MKWMETQFVLVAYSYIPFEVVIVDIFEYLLDPTLAMRLKISTS